MNFLKKLLEFILVCCVLHIASAQNPSNFRFYNSQNGLFANKIRQISQDSLGFMWLATNTGILKYDGNDFLNFNHIKDIPELSNSDILTLFTDSKQNIWIGCNKALIVYIKSEGLFKKINFSDTKKPYVNSITEDANGKIWIGTNSGIYFLQKNFATLGIKYNNRIDNVKFLKKRKRMCSVSFNKITIIDYNSFKVLKSFNYCNDTIFTDNIQTSVEEDSSGNLWIGKYNGDVYKIDTKTLNIEKYDFKKITKNESAIVNYICSDRNGKLWFCIDESGIYYYDFLRKTFIGYITPSNLGNKLSSFKLTTIYKDNEGSIWIGSEKNSLIFSNDKTSIYDNLSLNNISKTQIVSSVLEDSQKNLWVGTDGEGIFVFDSSHKLIKTFKYDGKKNSLPNNAVLCIFEDSKNRIWIGTFRGGLSLYNKTNNTFINYQHDPKDPHSISKNDVRKIIEGNGNNLWLSVHGKGVSEFDINTGSFKNFTKMSSPWTYDLFKDSKGNIWVATNEGISKKNYSDSVFTDYFSKTTNTLLDNHFNCFTEDENGTIWMGTQHGLYFTDKNCKNILTIPSFSFLQDLSINSITAFKKNELLLSSSKGIMILNLKTNEFKRLGITDGLPSEEFINNAKFYNKKSQTVYLGSSNGVIVIYPNHINDTQIAANPVINDIKIFNESIVPGTKQGQLKENVNYLKSLRLKYNQNHLIFDIACPSYILGKNNLILQYKLEGLDKDWQTLNNSKSATYPSIPPGEYLLISRFIINGKPSIIKKNLQLTITPPYWQTWWFRAALIIFASILIYGYFKIKTKRLTLANKELETKIAERTKEISRKNELLEIQKQELSIANDSKDKLFSIIAHDLRSPFGGIISLADMLSNYYEQHTNEQRLEIVSHIKKSTQSIYNTVENLLQWARTQKGSLKVSPQWFNLNNHLQNLKEIYRYVSQEKCISIILIIDKNFKVYIDKDMFEAILRNLINNAIKFSPRNSEITIEVKIIENGFKLSVCDQGIGMTQDQVNKLKLDNQQTSTRGTLGEKGLGLGLVITKDFLQLQKASWEIESALGLGTKIEICFACETETDINDNDNQLLKKEEVAESSVTWIKPQEIELLKNKKILVVEDQIAIRKSLRLQFENIFTIYEAEDGQEALEIAKNEMPDLIISDIVMPKMDGLEFSFKIKNDIGTCHIPIIMLTSQNEEDDVIKGLQTGVDDYLIKPYKLSILGLKIVKLLINREKLIQKFKIDDKKYIADLAQNSTDKNFVNQLFKVIEDNIADEDFGVEQLSQVMLMHRSNLSKKTTEQTGFSPVELIKIKRMKVAATLMSTSDKNVSEVAYAVGFSDPKYFSKVFKAYYGVLPSEYN